MSERNRPYGRDFSLIFPGVEDAQCQSDTTACRWSTAVSGAVARNSSPTGFSLGKRGVRLAASSAAKSRRKGRNGPVTANSPSVLAPPIPRAGPLLRGHLVFQFAVHEEGNIRANFRAKRRNAVQPMPCTS